MRIGFFSLIAENAEDFEAVQINVDALGRLSRACINEIGWQVSMQIVAFEHELSCKDYFCKKTRMKNEFKTEEINKNISFGHWIDVANPSVQSPWIWG
jgi:hypothetical protein